MSDEKRAPVVGRQAGHLLYAVLLSPEEWDALRKKPDQGVDWLALPTDVPGRLMLATTDPEHFGWSRR